MAYFAVTGKPLAAERETVNGIGVTPELPSDREVLEIDTTGTGSSSTIVPVAVAVPNVALTGPESATEKASFFSYSKSPATNTVKVVLVEPTGIVALPVFAV